MSSIVVAGDVSGSVTLSAPSAAGSVTVTLPASSGTMLTSATPFSNGQGPAFSAYQSTDQTGLSSGTYTKCNFQTEEYDTNSNFASSTFTPTVAGYYQVNWGADIYIAGGGSGFVVALFKNGTIAQSGSGMFSGSATELEIAGSALIYCNGSTDYLDVYVRATGGSARQTYAERPYTYFNGFLARAA